MNEAVRAGRGLPVDVSVIIPTYNRARLVVEAIESVLRQTAPPREIIVIDDGSTDDTPRAVEAFGDRIMYVRQENWGVGVARNRALAMARGRYLAFLDSDDVWLEFKLELQVAVMERMPEVGFLFSDFLITKDGKVKTTRGLRTWYHDPRPWEEVFEHVTSSVLGGLPTGGEVRVSRGKIYRALLAEPYVLPSSAVVRAECMTPETRFAEGVPVYEDWEFFSRLARTCTAAFLDVQTTINRGGDDRPRLTHTGAATKAEQRLRMIDNVWKADADFFAAHGREVTAVEADQCLHLARARLFGSEPVAALAALRRWAKLRDPRRWASALVLAVCALVPGSGVGLRGARELRARLAAAKPTPPASERGSAIDG